MKKYVHFDHDGVLVDTEFWYYKAGERALADIGLTLDKHQYLRDMKQGAGTWGQARPHPEPYLTGLKRLGATKEDTGDRGFIQRAELGRGGRY